MCYDRLHLNKIYDKNIIAGNYGEETFQLPDSSAGK